MIRFAVKHAVATAVVVTGIVSFTAATYGALLLWAILAGLPLGGPLAFPFMVLFALVATVGVVLFVLLPSTVATEWLRHRLQFPLLVEIPMATLLMVALVLGLTSAIAWLSGSFVEGATVAAAIGAGVLLVPLGAYWWALQSTGWVITVATTYSERLRTGHPGERTFKSDV